MSEDILFWKNLWNFQVSYFTPGNSRQNKASPLEILQNCVRLLENPRPKPKFWSKTPRNYLLFLQYPSKSHILNTNTPTSHPLPLSCLAFSQNSPLVIVTRGKSCFWFLNSFLSRKKNVCKANWRQTHISLYTYK